MPVKVGWLVEGSVVYHNWWGVGTLEDMVYVNDRMLEMYAQFPERPLIHTIANSLQQSKTEGGLGDIRKAYTVLDEPQTGWVILTTSNPVIRFVGNIAMQMGRKEKARLRILSDPKAAINFLHQVDGTVPWEDMDQGIMERFDAEMHAPV